MINKMLSTFRVEIVSGSVPLLLDYMRFQYLCLNNEICNLATCFTSGTRSGLQVALSGDLAMEMYQWELVNLPLFNSLYVHTFPVCNHSFIKWD